MSKFRKKGNKQAPSLSTASLPDIVFMLLFFFMTVTSMKEVDLKVRTELPDATEVKKLENKSLISYIYVGPPKEQYKKKLGENSVIQLNDEFQEVGDIAAYIQAERDNMDPENKAKMTTALKIDKSALMGIVIDIKQELRKAKALKISYNSKKVDEIQ
jgi:biopolymer transport protein ExbD